MHKPGVPEALSAWPGDRRCVFCNMLAAADYSIENGMSADEVYKAVYILDRGPSCFVVLNAFPYNAGHVMVVPYEHESALAALPAKTAAELLVVVNVWSPATSSLVFRCTA